MRCACTIRLHLHSKPKIGEKSQTLKEGPESYLVWGGLLSLVSSENVKS